MNAISDNLRRLTDFRGRQSRAMFWPYAGLVIAIGFVLVAVAMNVSVIPVLLSLQPGDKPNMIAVVAPFGLTVVFIIAALAAAVVRRLHDRGLPGWWALPTPLLLLTGILGMGVVMNLFLAEQTVSENQFVAPFGLLFLNNILYLGSLAALVFVLCMPGRAQGDRYGPPPT